MHDKHRRRFSELVMCHCRNVQSSVHRRRRMTFQFTSSIAAEIERIDAMSNESVEYRQAATIASSSGVEPRRLRPERASYKQSNRMFRRHELDFRRHRRGCIRLTNLISPGYSSHVRDKKSGIILRELRRCLKEKLYSCDTRDRRERFALLVAFVVKYYVGGMLWSQPGSVVTSCDHNYRTMKHGNCIIQLYFIYITFTLG